MRTQNAINTMGLAIVLAFAGCRTTPKVETIDESADVSAEMGKLQQKISAAHQDQQDVLAPTSFHKAQHYLNEANHQRDEGKSNRTILKSVAEGNAWIEQSNALANERREDFKEVLATRTDAINAGAADKASTELGVADKKLSNWTDSTDSVKLDMKDKEKLQKLYVEARIAALKNRYLSAAKADLNQAKKEGAERAVPSTLKEVEKSMQNALVFVESNYYKEAEFAQIAKGVETNSARLLNLTRDARMNKNKTPEQIALDKEAAAQAAAGQIAASEAAAAQAAQAAAASQAAASQTQQQLSQEARQVEAYKLNDQRQAAVKAMFSPDEADVLRTNDATVIRLKGLRYATGKAQLTADDYKLLSKAKEALKAAGATSVIVEGHTDAVGSHAKNKELSEHRADAVKKYFESTGDLQNISIESTGVGDQKPITSNKTKLGRATNRRVDLILKGNNADATAM